MRVVATIGFGPVGYGLAGVALVAVPEVLSTTDPGGGRVGSRSVRAKSGRVCTGGE